MSLKRSSNTASSCSLTAAMDFLRRLPYLKTMVFTKHRDLDNVHSLERDQSGYNESLRQKNTGGRRGF